MADQKMMTLTCRAGHEWQRPSQRGKPPHYCPKHKPGAAPAKPKKPVPDLMKALKASLEPNPNGGLAQLGGVGEIVLPQTTQYARATGEREWAHISTVQVGDWTHITGYRPVKAVKIMPRAKRIKITWSDDSSETYSFTYKDKQTAEARPRMLWVLRAANT